jgi:hypothetical protein
MAQRLVDKASPEMFVPLWQIPFGWAGELAVRTSPEPATVTRSIRAAAAARGHWDLWRDEFCGCPANP